jgi:hypothetical protein
VGIGSAAHARNHGRHQRIAFAANPVSTTRSCMPARERLIRQVRLSPAAKPKITPVLMFVGAVCGQAEKAVKFWASVFGETKIGTFVRYGKGEASGQEGTLKHGSFFLFGQE